MDIKLNRLNEFVWEIPTGTIKDMKVPARIIASEKLVSKMRQDRTMVQAAGVATLPGIYKYSVTLPDGHEGYGFPIGGVAALDYETGAISPGGIGYDINCGVRLLRTKLDINDVRQSLKEIVNQMFRNVPSGVGSKGLVKVKSEGDLDSVLKLGAKWAVENGYGLKEDLNYLEEHGTLAGADPKKVSHLAKQRGMPQVGSLGSGNHFLEIQRVDKIYDEKIAKVFGIERENQAMVMIHTGSRGLGHQVCSDYLRTMEKKYHDIIATLPDRELVYAPAGSETANDYFAAMASAANFAWCNRQMIVHWVRESFESVFRKDADSLGLKIIYDVAHNIAKIEEHKVNRESKKVYVHRKGATRAFPPNHKDIPQEYRSVGQPVLLPGSMGTASYVLVGTQKAMEESFGSTAHGAGRELSRHEAVRRYKNVDIEKALEQKGTIVKAASWKGILEEVPEAYKDIDEVARVSDAIGIGKFVARLVPVGVVKG